MPQGHSTQQYLSHQQKLQAVIDAFRREGYEVTGGPPNYNSRCPNHEDDHYSLSIKAGIKGIVFRCFHGCEQDELIEAVAGFIGFQKRDFFYNGAAPASSAPMPTVAELAQAKKLPPDLFARACVCDSPRGILFPYGTGYRVRRRVALSSDYNRFLWEKGTEKITAYGAWMVEQYRAGGTLFLVEGETDTLTGLYYRLPVLGIPSKTMARSVIRNNPNLVTGIEDIFVIEEPDDYQRRDFLHGVKRAITDIGWHGDIYPMRLPVKDLSDLHIQRGPEVFMPAFQAAYEAAVDAVTWPDVLPIPPNAAGVFATIRKSDFPLVFNIQDIKNRHLHKDLKSEEIRIVLDQLTVVNAVRMLPAPRSIGRPSASFKTNPKMR